jgi:hypothetical protein
MELPKPKITALVLLLGLGGYFLVFPFGFPLGFIKLTLARPPFDLPIPLGWQIMVKSSIGSTYSGPISIDRAMDIEYYYIGNGIIVKNIHTMPGRMSSRQERVTMDRETKIKFEKSLRAITPSWVLGDKVNLQEIRTTPPKEAFTYDSWNILFPSGKEIYTINRASLQGGESIDSSGNEDLDFVLDTLVNYHELE